ncbi:Deoxyribonuclease-2-alpha [Trichinella nelsoni]|uniref:Deoxyribonuclease-2-alpha n=1 Tax=Trichinella nelsoni TaxID=6336 RepID=A0A0V0SMB3_9BILA|nr:Deoxyribonuclease-2-alpha [Trichinella nelsoni]
MNCFVESKCMLIFLLIFPNPIAATSKCRTQDGNADTDWYLNFYRAILYKAAGRNDGRIITAANGAWQQSPAPVGNPAGNSFGKALEHVAVVDPSAKFVAYNNKPPNAVGVQTNSNSKGILIMHPDPPTDSAAWIIHTVPGFPKALQAYTFPAEEIAKGHLFVCFTIKEEQLDVIAHALRIARPVVYHHDIPATEVNSRPNLKNLLNGDSSVLPPLTISKEIKATGNPGIKVSIFSKGEKSGYEMFKRVLSKKLKKDLKVWTTRDTNLKGDCRILGRNIKLITSPISVSGDASTLENDVSQWAVTEPGNIFCAIDKPYHKNQRKEPALAVCIDDATIFTRFNELITGTDACN